MKLGKLDTLTETQLQQFIARCDEELKTGFRFSKRTRDLKALRRQFEKELEARKVKV